MRRTVLVAGTGRMGRSIGLHFLRCGYSVCWLTREQDRREEFSRRLARDVRRLAPSSPGADAKGRVSTACYGDSWPTEALALVDAVVETRDAKVEVLERVVPRLCGDALVLSATSSLLPGELHPRAIVTHFFPPLELAGFAEVVWPSDCTAPRRERVLELLRSLGLEALEQDTESAFAATRLLLPLQNECFRAFEEGFSRTEVEEASRSPLFPMGQLSFIERVGPATVLSAVENYRSRMAPRTAAEYEPLARGLRALAGPPIAPSAQPTPKRSLTDLHDTLLCALLNACYRLVDAGHLDHRGLDLVLTGFFWAEVSPAELLTAAGPARVLDLLRKSHCATGLSYFVPTASLGV